MNNKTTQIIIGRKELIDIFKGKEAEITARISENRNPEKINQGITEMLNKIIKKRYLGIGG